MDKAEVIHRLWQLKATAKITEDKYALDIAVEALLQEPKIVRCKDCRHNNNCDIQLAATANENFSCLAGEPKKMTLEEWQELDKAIQGVAESATTTDCISRQAVEEMIKEEMPERGMWEIEGDKEKETVCEVCVDLMQKLSELSPVEPERPKGKWKYGNGNGECPFCGRERQLGWDNFCGFCGADMRGEK